MEYKRIQIVENVEDSGTIKVDRSRLVNLYIDTNGRILDNVDGGLLEISRYIEFKGKAIYLSASYNWVLGKDKAGDYILVPLKKD